MILHSEGLQYESVEDVTGTDAALEPTHTDEDETYYVEWILSGHYDEEASFECERDFPEDYFTQSDLDYFADRAADDYERAMTAHW